jgi:UDP-glucuronate decarboxylase
VLVTGGAGFIGSHLTRRLLAAGHEVLVVDNFYSGTRSNIEDLQGDPRFELLRHDVTFPLYVEVDEIYHLACPASPVFYQRDPVQTTKTCVHGSINMLGLAKRTGAKILLASTSEVYGDPEMHPQREEYWGNVNPVGPRGVYDEAKRYSEAMTMAYHRQQGVDTHIARIFNTYGPRMRQHDGRAIPNFLRQALEGKPITVFGDGSQTRSFCYVDDLIEGLFRLAMSDYHLPVNVGNPDEMTLVELAERIVALTGTRSEIVFEGLPIDDPKVRQPDITRAREILGWEPKVTLDEGLRRTIESLGRTPVPA